MRETRKMKKTVRIYKRSFVISSVIFALFCAFVVHASVNIPLGSAFYDDISTLVSKGLIKSDLSSTKPFSGAEAARLLVEAKGQAEKTGLSTSVSNLLDRISKEYKDEISEANAPGSAHATYIKPMEELSISYNFLDGPYSVFNNEGIEYYDGHNATARFQSTGKLWNVVSFYIEPMFLYNQNVENIDGDEEGEVRLHKGYVKFNFRNLDMQIGRDSLWWGPGYHGSLLMSNNAKPFDMIKLSNQRATLLPWVFSYLGPFRFNIILSRLDDSDHKIINSATGDDLSKPYLHGARLNFKPHPLVELGLSHLVMFGGEGRRVNAADFFKIAYTGQNRDNGRLDSNQESAVDIALTIPDVDKFIIPIADSIKFYGEIGGEDTGLPPDRRAYLAGFGLNDLFTVQGMKLRAEYANLSPNSVPTAWYRHGSYPMQYEDRVFGHHAGTDSDDLFIELSQKFENRFYYKIGFDKERKGISRSIIQEKYQYFFETGCHIEERFDVNFRYAYEEIENFENRLDDNRTNNFVGLEFKYDF